MFLFIRWTYALAHGGGGTDTVFDIGTSPKYLRLFVECGQWLSGRPPRSATVDKGVAPFSFAVGKE